MAEGGENRPQAGMPSARQAGLDGYDSREPAPLARTDAVSDRHAARWCLVPRPLPKARLRLICLPHAGAGASTYFGWGALLQPAGIEVRSVQYPGRENRLSEACLTDAETMTRAIADAWPELAGGGPCAIFGHSMGALLGFELALELARRGSTHQPVRLFVSGHNAPSVLSPLPTLHLLPDCEFLPAVSRHYGDLPAELTMSSEMAALITPILRADFQLVDRYRWRNGPQASAAISVLGGLQDPWTTRAGLEQWSHHTRGPFSCRLLPGNHFFHQQNRATVISVIESDLLA